MRYINDMICFLCYNLDKLKLKVKITINEIVELIYFEKDEL